jgi:hypothetical protein
VSEAKNSTDAIATPLTHHPYKPYPPSPDFVKDKDSLIRIWCHECQRVFGDRLINSQDRDWFAGMVAEKVKEHFSVEYAKARGPHEVSKSVMLVGDSVGEVHRSDGKEPTPGLTLPLAQPTRVPTRP